MFYEFELFDLEKGHIEGHGLSKKNGHNKGITILQHFSLTNRSAEIPQIYTGRRNVLFTECDIATFD